MKCNCGADFTAAFQAMAQAIVDHADADGLTGLQRAVFLARGGHAPGERCPRWTEEPVKHEYWCRYPEDECICPAGLESAERREE